MLGIRTLDDEAVNAEISSWFKLIHELYDTGYRVSLLIGYNPDSEEVCVNAHPSISNTEAYLRQVADVTSGVSESMHVVGSGFEN